LFISNRFGKSDIYTIDADGTNLTRLTGQGGDDFYASWSPDGDKILFCSDRGGNNEIYIMSSNGGDFRKIRISEYQ